MNIFNRKKRIIMISIMAAAVSFMIYFNVNGMVDSVDYSARLNMICLIFLVAFLFFLYIIFEAYRIMYEEMTERVNTITANKNDLQTIYNSIDMLLIEVNDEGQIININDSVCSYIGRKKNHILGKTISKAFPMEPEAIQKIEQMVKTSFEKKVSVNDEFETGGSIFEASVSISKDTPDSNKKVLLVLNDVTQERANYRQMMQDNKMIAVGHLAAGVAHEIRNPLGLIRTYSHLLKKSPNNPEVREKAIPMIDYAVDRSSIIIDNLLGFSRISNTTWDTIDVLPAIESMIKLEEHELKSRNINIDINCPDMLRLKTISESFQIILINLINNAIDAIEKNGSVSISCTEEQDRIIIVISDTGPGIPEKIKHDIFNPFFTTKENRNGSGLGLYIVYNEILKLKGKIEVESSDGKGTSFIVTLPVKEGIDNNEQQL